jgi:hypothetical protein
MLCPIDQCAALDFVTAAALAKGVRLHLVESHSGFLREWLDMFRLDVAVPFNITDPEGLELTPYGTLAAKRIVRPTIERHAALACVARRPKTRAQQAVVDLMLIAQIPSIHARRLGWDFVAGRISCRLNLFQGIRLLELHDRIPFLDSLSR